MDIAIIGAGNMGGAIARGLAKGTTVETARVRVADPGREQLERLRREFPALQLTSDNREAAEGAGMVILAVKPWLVEEVLRALPLADGQVLISVAAGVDFARLESLAGTGRTLFRVVPNTAIARMASMTLVASHHASPEQEAFVLRMFGEMGLAMPVAEKQIPATMALTSCGIAFVLKYIQAAMQAGVELGLYPQEARRMVAQSVKGAAELILADPAAHPSTEIDKVTTPGGLTIRGINELEHGGFTSAVIRAMKACC